MSVNRSVQAAQRRRTAPTDPGVPGRGPQPSINSAQMFASQARPGQGPNIPTGRLAGQQAASMQQQMQQQAYSQQNQKEGLSTVSKMTIPQAITLITLRLGVIESKLMHMPESGMNMNTCSDGELDLDSGVVQSILSRLESLEKRSSSSTGTSSTPELNLIKQQVETLKQAVVQSKGASTTLVKENANLKTQVDNLRKELSDAKELLAVLQNLSMENSQKILELSVGVNNEYFEGQELYNDISNVPEIELETLEDEEQNEIIGNDLKQLIESELNTE